MRTSEAAAPSPRPGAPAAKASNGGRVLAMMLLISIWLTFLNWPGNRVETQLELLYQTDQLFEPV